MKWDGKRDTSFLLISEFNAYSTVNHRVEDKIILYLSECHSLFLFLPQTWLSLLDLIFLPGSTMSTNLSLGSRCLHSVEFLLPEAPCSVILAD